MRHSSWRMALAAVAGLGKSRSCLCLPYCRGLGRRAGTALWLSLAIAGGLSACGDAPRDAAREARRQLAGENYKDHKDIRLAVVWDKGKGEFLSGAMLAAEEINAEGGVDGRRLLLEFTDEGPFLASKSFVRSKAEGRYSNAEQETGVAIAQAVVADPDVAAVIGHSNSEAALSAMLTYQTNGVLFLAGGTTDSRIMWSSDELYFQLLPHDETLAKRMAAEIVSQKWDNVYIVYTGARHDEQVVELLKTEFANSGIQLAGEVTILDAAPGSAVGARRTQAALAELRQGDVDALVLIAPPLLGARVIRQSRALGIVKPFFGTRSLDTPRFREIIGDASGDLIIASLRSKSYQLQRFAGKFKKRFPDAAVDESAAIGYDSVRLYAEAVASAGTTEPFLVSHALNYKLPLWYGLLGSYTFKNDRNANLKYYIRKLERGKDGKLQFVSDDKAY